MAMATVLPMRRIIAQGVNPDQLDSDGDERGDTCDARPDTPIFSKWKLLTFGARLVDDNQTVTGGGHTALTEFLMANLRYGEDLDHEDRTCHGAVRVDVADCSCPRQRDLDLSRLTG